MKTTKTSESAAALKLLTRVFSRVLDPECTNLPVFVAIDTEVKNGELSEIGFSTFDPGVLRSPNNPDSLNEKMTTACYRATRSKKRRNYKPYRLGPVVHLLRNSDLQRVIDINLQPGIGEKVRNVILVGHEISNDLKILRKFLGFDLGQMSNVEAIVDTRSLFQLIFPSEQRSSLRHVLLTLRLEYIGLHNAAHDSRYTLRALLMLFVQFKRSNSQVAVDSTSLMSHMESIARCHKPNPRRTWSASTRVKSDRDPCLFDQDLEDQVGMLNLLDTSCT